MATEFDHLAEPPIDREFKAGDRIRMVADIVTPRSSRALGEVKPTRPAGQRSRQSGAGGKREEDVRLTRGPWKRCREDRLSECSEHQKAHDMRSGVHISSEMRREHEAEQRKSYPAELPRQERGRVDERGVDVVREHEHRRDQLDQVERRSGH
jgi:hypothetical protein